MEMYKEKINNITKTLSESIQSKQYIQVRRRIFRQLITSLIYEGVISPEISIENEQKVFLIKGLDKDREPVYYRCLGVTRFTFDRIHLLETPLERISGKQIKEASSLTQFLLEIEHSIDTDESKLLLFANELESTLINDTHAQYVRYINNKSQKENHYDEWESDIMEGHPYHPCYKSRIGFSFEDNFKYGPEFKQELLPLWVAVQKSEIKQSISIRFSHQSFLIEEVGQDQFSSFEDKIHSQGVDPNDYVFIPIHPWQWKNIVTTVYLKELREKHIILLGHTNESYRSQQSIRTVTNITSPKKSYLKLSMSIVNTSTGRILAPHTVQNAAPISDWLKDIVLADDFLLKETRVVLLGETLAICYDPPLLSEKMLSSTYGVLSCIWRESLHSFLENKEDAIPFNALTTLDLKGRPLINDWLIKYGIDNWLLQLFETSILPVIHFLYAHGIALETHAQNMILIHEDGMPSRVALKDFHDGIRFSKKHLNQSKEYPELKETPNFHAQINKNSFLETDDVVAVRDFIHDALFFINFGELALFMKNHYKYDELKFWGLIRNVIESYQKRFPQLEERYRLFNLFAPTIQVEQLTKRRLFPDTEIRVHQVTNPLSK